MDFLCGVDHPGIADEMGIHLWRKPYAPIQLESGRLQLTDDEILLYAPASARIAETFREYLPLHEPMTQKQFVKLFLAHSVVIGDAQVLDEVMAVAEAELARCKNKH